MKVPQKYLNLVFSYLHIDEFLQIKARFLKGIGLSFFHNISSRFNLQTEYHKMENNRVDREIIDHHSNKKRLRYNQRPRTEQSVIERTRMDDKGKPSPGV